MHINININKYYTYILVWSSEDQIYNMACPASPVHYQFNPIKTTKVSVIGTINMMGLAKRVKARILQASTSEIYGDPEAKMKTFR